MDQPTNAEDAAAGNLDAIRHTAYAEGYRDGKILTSAEIRAEVLEEAAKLCDAEYTKYLAEAGENNSRESDFAFGSVNSAERLGAAIRALK